MNDISQYRGFPESKMKPSVKIKQDLFTKSKNKFKYKDNSGHGVIHNQVVFNQIQFRAILNLQDQKSRSVVNQACAALNSFSSMHYTHQIKTTLHNNQML